MTDRQIIERARASLGVRAPVFLRPLGIRSDTVRGAYVGTDATGAHCIRIDDSLRGIARIYALAHECVHAAQAETLGGAAQFDSAYRIAGAWLADGSGRAAYRRNPYERDAQARGAAIAAEIAGELEGDA